MDLNQLVSTRDVIICCGAGGVGKTTASAALALTASRKGRRALVLTIDPARRLAQAMGIPPTGKEPVEIGRELLFHNGIELAKGGELHAWMLDPQVVLDSVVDRFAPNEAARDRIRETRLFHALREVMAGLQEYTAAEALYSFTQQGRYDLIVLDTPPSRNALDFLDAPRRLARFLDERTLQLFAPDSSSKAGALVHMAAKMVSTALQKAFGESFAGELQQFLGAFGSLFGKMRLHAEGVRKLLRSERAAFLVVTSPEEAALEEAVYFKRRIKELGLLTEGFILNRSYASEETLLRPEQAIASLAPNESVLLAALEKLKPMAEIEGERATRDRAVLERLEIQGRLDEGQGAVALPYLDQAVEDLPALAILSGHILRL